MGDPDRLQQVVWNLISQRGPLHARRRHGRSSRSARDDVDDTLEVRDTGAGIEPQFIPFMFEPFRQADGASTRAHGGLGIGLTIVRRLTEMHGGTVSVASDGLGKGATLTVTLPVRHPARATADRGAATRPRRVADAGHGAGRRRRSRHAASCCSRRW